MERMISPEIMPSVRRLSLKFVKNYGVVSLCSQCPEYTHNVQNIQIIILHFQIKKNSSFFYYQIKICFLRFVSCLWRNVSLKTDSVTKSCFSVLSCLYLAMAKNSSYWYLVLRHLFCLLAKLFAIASRESGYCKWW